MKASVSSRSQPSLFPFSGYLTYCQFNFSFLKSIDFIYFWIITASCQKIVFSYLWVSFISDLSLPSFLIEICLLWSLIACFPWWSLWIKWLSTAFDNLDQMGQSSFPLYFKHLHGFTLHYNKNRKKILEWHLDISII